MWLDDVFQKGVLCISVKKRRSPIKRTFLSNDLAKIQIIPALRQFNYFLTLPHLKIHRWTKISASSSVCRKDVRRSLPSTTFFRMTVGIITKWSASSMRHSSSSDEKWEEGKGKEGGNRRRRMSDWEDSSPQSQIDSGEIILFPALCPFFSSPSLTNIITLTEYTRRDGLPSGDCQSKHESKLRAMPLGN